MGESDIPKVMYTVAGTPMIGHVIKTALAAGSEKIIVIVGHKKELVMEYIRVDFAKYMNQIEFSVQEELLGTGHAAMQAEKNLRGFVGNIVILSGDTPLVQVKTLQNLESTHIKNGWVASLISGHLENPFGYGRILRNEHGHFFAIREERDASDEERKVQEVNSGMYFVDAVELFKALHTVRTDNAQGEYYLTDIFAHFEEIGLPMGAIAAKDTLEILGVNTKEQLETIEKMWSKK